MLESINVANVVRRHLDGFRNPTTRRMRKKDLALHYGLPVLIGGAWAVLAPSTSHLGNLVAGLAVITGLFFGLLVYVFQLRLDLTQPVDYQRSTQLVGLVDVLFHNTVYATLVGGIATVAAVVTDLLGVSAGPIVGVTIALAAHLVLTMIMIITRASAAYLELVKDKRRAAVHR